MTDLQPPPLECQFCGVDIATGSHKLTCRIVVDIWNIPGWLDIPAHLRRTRSAAAAPVETESSSVFD